MIHWFSHDSIGLGEDGPTHQPVEQLASLRAMPGLNVIRPCDANEVAEAWRVMMAQKHQPRALVLTRQNVPVLDRSRYAPAEGPRARRLRARRLRRRAGADPDRDRQRGIARHRRLRGARCDGVRARVVSLPSWYLFDLQPPSTAKASCRRPSRRGSPWNRDRRWAGTATLGRAADRRHAHLR